MLTLSRRHVTSDDDSELVKLRGDSHHNTGFGGNVFAVLTRTKLGQV